MLNSSKNKGRSSGAAKKVSGQKLDRQLVAALLAPILKHAAAAESAGTSKKTVTSLAATIFNFDAFQHKYSLV